MTVTVMMQPRGEKIEAKKKQRQKTVETSFQVSVVNISYFSMQDEIKQFHSKCPVARQQSGYC